MNNKIKNIVVSATFIAFMAFFAVMCTIAYFNPVKTSESERRPLAQFPEEITWEGVLDKTVIEDFEDYTVDQFPFREFFRSLKANFHLNILGLKENNGLTELDGYITKIHAEAFGLIAMELGAGRATKESEIDLSVGIKIHKKVGDYVRKGESLARLYANDLTKLKAASPRLQAAYKLSKERIEAPKHVLGIVTKDGCTRF